MDPAVLAALIGLAGALAGAILQAFLPEWVARYRARNAALPSLVGAWSAEWYLSEEGGDHLYVKDSVVVQAQKGFRVEARGVEEKGAYVLEGRFSSANLVTFRYQSENPAHSLVGVVMLQLDPMGRVLRGKWWGYVKEGRLAGGTVAWWRTATPRPDDLPALPAPPLLRP